MPQYTYDDLKSDVTNAVHGTIENADFLRIINRGVKATLNNVDLRSTKRKAALSPALDSTQHDYAAPSDLKGNAIIDIRRQVNREEDFTLLTEEEFDRTKTTGKSTFALADSDFVRVLRIASDIEENHTILHNMDSITANGTWSAGGDASNLTLDSLNYVQGSGSLNFDTASGASTAYIENSTLASTDLSGHELSDIFVWVYVPNVAIPTNFILRIGSDSSNYYSQTVTTNNEGLAFYAGWNLLRFNLATATATGSPNIAAIDYLRLTITKDVGDAAATDWRVDAFVAIQGIMHSVVYYSKYLWQSSSGTYLQDSTAITDLINVDADEYEIVVLKCAEFAAIKLDNDKDTKRAREDYDKAVAAYRMRYPSEAKTQESTYFDL